MKRSEVKEQYKWDLSRIFKDADEFEKAFKEVGEEVKAFCKYKGKLNDRSVLLNALKDSSKFEQKLESVYVYSSMKMHENTGDNKGQTLAARGEMLIGTVSAETSWMNPELSEIAPETLLKWAAEPDFKDYSYMLREVVRNKKHILSKEEERIIALARDSVTGYEEVFNMIDNVEVPLGEIEVDGKMQKLTHGSYSVFLNNPDQSVRKKAFDKLYGAYYSLVNTIAAAYSGNVKGTVFTARARGYEDCLSMALDGDNIPKEVYTNLIEAVGAGTPALHDYIRLRKKVLGIDLHMYDLMIPIVKGFKMEMEYEDAYALVVKALAPMGKEYTDLLEMAYKSRWIDVYETENKRSGAYSWGSYRTNYVLLNYQKTTHDVFTIAHEMGHCLHSYFSDRAQTYPCAQYNIFVAEVASTVNEVLLLKYLIKNSKDDEQRRFLYSYYLDMFRTTLFRQTMFSEFEYISHGMAERNEPLTKDVLSEKYLELNKKYYGDGVIHDDQIQDEWSRIPHFYRDFYVYKYSTGITSAVNIANAILTEGAPAVDRYKKFLSSGGTDSPYEILKISGVDLKKKDAFNFAIKEFDASLKELKKLF